MHPSQYRIGGVWEVASSLARNLVRTYATLLSAIVCLLFPPIFSQSQPNSEREEKPHGKGCCRSAEFVQFELK